MPACKHPRNTYTQPSLTGKRLLKLQTRFSCLMSQISSTLTSLARKAGEEEDAIGFRRSRSAS